MTESNLQLMTLARTDLRLEDSLPARKLLGLTIHDVPLEEMLIYLDERIVQRYFTHVIPVNPHVYLNGVADDSYFDILRQGDLVTCDGVGIMLAGSLLKSRVHHRVVGTDLMLGLSGLAAHKKYGIFLLGGSNRAAERCATALTRQWPTIKICGVEELPTFENVSELDNDRIIGHINRSGADMLFVALGSPKQEEWIKLARPFLKVRLAMGVGASFNLIGGIIPRAPRWVRSIGFEWLFRLFHEPRRLWKRYLIGNPRFLLRILLTLGKPLENT